MTPTPSVLADVVARERRSSDLALRADAAGREYSWHDFCTTAYKAGNFLRYLGVAAGDTVAVGDDPLPEAVLTFVGAAQLGALTRFGPDETADVRAVVVHHAREADFGVPAGCNLAVYGGPPDATGTAHWERDVWSENPAFPPTDVDPDDPAVAAAGATYSHRALLDAAAGVVSEHGLDADSTVAVRASLTRPGVVAAGVVAPLVAGGTVVFPDAETVCDVAVGGDAVPEAVRVDPDGVW